MKTGSLTAAAARDRLRALGTPEAAVKALRYFKTGPGEYAEGDVFLGIRAAEMRRTAKEFRDLSMTDIEELLRSEVHEDRMLALLILVGRSEKGGPYVKKCVCDLYLSNTDRVNSWDLVDGSAPGIVGAYLVDKPRDVLDSLARSSSLWERRIAIVATLYFIRRGDHDDALRIAEILLDDREDLIHKAAGWMLREVWKKDLEKAESFLKKHLARMPRTMLRYAIERFPKTKRLAYLNGSILD